MTSVTLKLRTVDSTRATFGTFFDAPAPLEASDALDAARLSIGTSIFREQWDLAGSPMTLTVDI